MYWLYEINMHMYICLAVELADFHLILNRLRTIWWSWPLVVTPDLGLCWISWLLLIRLNSPQSFWIAVDCLWIWYDTLKIEFKNYVKITFYMNFWKIKTILRTKLTVGLRCRVQPVVKTMQTPTIQLFLP